MPRFTVLQFISAAGEQLMVEPAAAAPIRHPAGVTVLGVVQVPMSTRLTMLSPVTLHVPGHGLVPLRDIVDGTRVVPGVTWIPGALD